MIKRIKFTRTSTVIEEGVAEVVVKSGFTKEDIETLLTEEKFKKFALTSRKYGDIDWNYEIEEEDA